MRDESLYIYVLEAVLEAPFLDEVSKIRPAHLLELALKNRVGEPATDFTYTLVDGKKGTLYHTKADCLLLFFYNPDCHACKEITDQLAASPFVTEWIKNNKLKSWLFTRMRIWRPGKNIFLICLQAGSILMTVR